MATLVVNEKYVNGVDPEELKRRIYWELNWYYNALAVQLKVEDIEIKLLDSDALIQDYMVDVFGTQGLGQVVRLALKKLGIELDYEIARNKNA